MSITRSQIARQLMARGGMMSETAASYSSPTARAADDRFSPASDSGNGGGNPPPITITDNVPNYPEQGIFSKLINTFSPYAAGYAGTVLGGPFAGKKFFDVAKEEAEKNQKTEDLVRDAILSGSQVFSIPSSFQQAYNKQYGIPNIKVTEPTFTGGDNQPIKLPIIAQTPTDVDNELSDFDIYMQSLGQNRFSLDPRFAAAEGGTPRQAYGLGSIVKKITKPVEKILKSDVGKAALLAAGTYFAGGGGNPFTAKGRKAFDFTNIFSKKNPLFFTDEQFSPFKTMLSTTALATLMGDDEEEENLDQISSREDTSDIKKTLALFPEYRFNLKPAYRSYAATGGRIGYEDAGMVNPDELPMSREGSPMFTDTETGKEVSYPYNEEMSSAPNIDAELYQMYLDAIGSGQIPRATTFDQYKELMSDRMGAKEGGLMDLGGMEKDYRAEGGFVPIGKEEKADDVPARLSKNEFVFTADAVRAAGNGDIDKGAEVMYNVMKHLESGGNISDESQGLEGARNMFQTSQRLGEIL